MFDIGNVASRLGSLHGILGNWTRMCPLEAELTAKLCSAGQYVSFSRDQLLQRDAATNAKVAAQEIACGLSTINEARAKKNDRKVPKGDIPLVTRQISHYFEPLSRAPAPAAAS